MVNEKFFPHAEVPINYYEGPENGPPLILLHGVTGRWQSFLTLIPFLTPFRKVYALDLRGHGKSGRGPGPYLSSDYEDDVSKFIETEIGEPVVLFGHSLGGRISLQLARHHPAAIRAVIIGDTRLTPFQPSNITDESFTNTFRMWKGMVESGMSLDALVHAIGEMVGRTGPNGEPQRFKEYWDATELRFTAQSLKMVDVKILADMVAGRATADNDLIALSDQVTCPVLFLQGDPELGGLLKDGDLEIALAKFKGSAAVRIAGAGHGLHREKPLPVANAVLNFLTTL